MRNASLPAALALCWALTAPAHAQFGETIDVRIMNLEVVVTDQAGNRVQGLGADDFEVREGRKIREITNFTEYRSGRGTAAAVLAQETSVETRPPMNLVIFVDTLQWSRLDHRRIGESLLAMLDRELRPGDRVRITGWRRRVFDLVGWTEDHARIRKGIGDAFRLSIDSMQTRETGIDEKALQAEQAYDAEVGAESGSETGHGAGASSLEALMDNSQRLVYGKMRWRQLASIADSMSEMEGRRGMIIISSGMGRFNGKSFSSAVDDTEHLSSGMWDVREMREAFTRSALGANVAVSMLYPEIEPGLAGPPTSSILDSSVMSEIANRTGGTFGLAIGSIEDSMPRIASDLGNYYSLGFRSDLAEGDLRKVKVTLKDRSLVVRTREAIVRTTDREALGAAVIARAFGPLPSQMPLLVKLENARKAGKNREVKVTVRFRFQDLMFTEGPREAVAGFVVAAVTTDSRTGATGEVIHDRHEVRIPLAKYRQIPQGQLLTWDSVVRYGPESDTIAVGVRDEVSNLTGLETVALPVLE